LQGAGDIHVVDLQPVACQRRALTIGFDTRLFLIVNEQAYLAQRPTKLSTWIVRQVPKHFAQPLPPMRSSRQRQVGEQRTRLLRLRQQNRLAVAQELEFAEESDLHLWHNETLRSKLPQNTTHLPHLTTLATTVEYTRSDDGVFAGADRRPRGSLQGTERTAKTTHPTLRHGEDMSTRHSVISLFATRFRSVATAIRYRSTPDFPRHAEFLTDFRADPRLFDGGDATRWKGRRGGRQAPLV
jgi:hypothetical protein